jgi:lipoprotein-anchoring transpeptidase ErfK/SrfK
MPSHLSELRSRRPLAAWRLATLALVLAAACGVTPPRPEPPKAVAKEPYLLLRLNERRLYLVENSDAKYPQRGYPVAVGRAQFPTPEGHFQVNEMVENPDFLAFDFTNPSKPNKGHVPPGPNNPLGLRWIGFASSKFGWQVGFHGTANTSVLGQAVSHGCVRMSNTDVVDLYKRVKVGTVVVVEP